MTTRIDDKSPHQPPTRTINIFINDVKKVAPDDHMTGEEIKQLGGIPQANHLFREVPGPGDDDQVFDDKPYKLKSGMRFYDVPVGNLG
jgi:hypothetical protein